VRGEGFSAEGWRLKVESVGFRAEGVGCRVDGLGLAGCRAPRWGRGFQPEKALRGLSQGSLLEMGVRSWSHFVGIYRQSWKIIDT